MVVPVYRCTRRGTVKPTCYRNLVILPDELENSGNVMAVGLHVTLDLLTNGGSFDDS